MKINKKKYVRQIRLTKQQNKHFQNRTFTLLWAINIKHKLFKTEHLLYIVCRKKETLPFKTARLRVINSNVKVTK